LARGGSIKYNRKKIRKEWRGSMNKTRSVSLSLRDEEFEMYRKLAKMEGKSFSKWLRDKVDEALKQEMKEANLLNRLIKLIEGLPEKLQTQVQAQAVAGGGGSEEFSQVVKFLIYLIKLIELECEYTIVLEAKRKEFQARKEELKQTLGVEL
jgi:hypothetical protein